MNTWIVGFRIVSLSHMCGAIAVSWWPQWNKKQGKGAHPCFLASLCGTSYLTFSVLQTQVLCHWVPRFSEPKNHAKIYYCLPWSPDYNDWTSKLYSLPNLLHLFWIYIWDDVHKQSRCFQCSHTCTHFIASGGPWLGQNLLSRVVLEEHF